MLAAFSQISIKLWDANSPTSMRHDKNRGPFNEEPGVSFVRLNAGDSYEYDKPRNTANALKKVIVASSSSRGRKFRLDDTRVALCIGARCHEYRRLDPSISIRLYKT